MFKVFVQLHPRPALAEAGAAPMSYAEIWVTTATRYALLASLLALTTATPSFAQTRPGTAVDSGYPP